MKDKTYRLVEYVPPKPEAIRAFARSVCEMLADRTDNPAFMQPHAIRWLTDFLELAARVEAKRLNAGQSVDNNEK